MPHDIDHEPQPRYRLKWRDTRTGKEGESLVSFTYDDAYYIKRYKESVYPERVYTLVPVRLAE